MNQTDRAQAAQRLLDDPLANELLDEIEKLAIEGMLAASDDGKRREARDTVNTIRALRGHLRMTVAAHNEAKRPRRAVA